MSGHDELIERLRAESFSLRQEARGHMPFVAAGLVRKAEQFTEAANALEAQEKALRYISGEDVAGMEAHLRPDEVARAALDPASQGEACERCGGTGRVHDGNAFGWPWTIPCPDCGTGQGGEKR